MHSKYDNIEFIINDKAIKELFDWLKNRHQNNLELMKSSEFGINCVHLLQYKCYKISLTHCGSYIDSPD